MYSVVCSNCGIEFGMPDFYNEKRRDDHATFWCPNGHAQHYPGESNAEKYQRLYNAESQKLLPMREQLAAAQRKLEQTSKKLKRTEKRAAAGVCPCCNRTFKQLAQHMESQHKDFRQLQGLSAPKQLGTKIQ